MEKMKFNISIYPKIALLKAAYSFTDRVYLHLDADDKYYYIEITQKDESKTVSEHEFENEILAQCVRHEILNETKEIRKLILARALATTVVSETEEAEQGDVEHKDMFKEDDILKDWFEEYGKVDS